MFKDYIPHFSRVDSVQCPSIRFCPRPVGALFGFQHLLRQNTVLTIKDQFSKTDIRELLILPVNRQLGLWKGWSSKVQTGRFQLIFSSLKIPKCLKWKYWIKAVISGLPVTKNSHVAYQFLVCRLLWARLVYNKLYGASYSQ